MAQGEKEEEMLGVGGAERYLGDGSPTRSSPTGRLCLIAGAGAGTSGHRWKWVALSPMFSTVGEAMTWEMGVGVSFTACTPK